MKKIGTLILIFLITLSVLNIKPIYAAGNDEELNTNFINYTKDDEADCSAIIPESAQEIIKDILGYFRILAPIALIIYTAADLLSYVVSNEPGAKPPMGPYAHLGHYVFWKIFRRGVAAIMLFLVPTIVLLILNLDGVKEALGVDPTCGVTLSIKDENRLVIE